MTDADRIRLLNLNNELMAKIGPIQEQLKPLQAQLNAVTALILADLKPEFVFRYVPFDCGEVAVFEPKLHC